MDKIKTFFLTRSPLRILGMLVIGFVALVLIIWLIGFALRPLSPHMPMFASAPSWSISESDMVGYGKGGGGGIAVGMPGVGMAELSVRNVASMMPEPYYMTGTIGGDAESFEATDYSGYFETGDLVGVCGDLEALKSKMYVVFENLTKGDRNCDYSFKVEKDHVPEILSVLKSLEPKYLTENTRTIKPALEDFTSAEEILTKKLEAIEETLEEAQNSYDQLRILATSARDAESLAKVIESKINLIERLTLERLSLRSELDRLARDKALQLDRLDYVYFNVSVFEKRIVDFETIKDSWIAELQRFANEFNQLLQALTIGVLKLALYVILAAVYVVILVLIAKYGWRLMKRLWSF